MLVVVATEEEARNFHEQLLVWQDDTTDVLLFPKPDALPYEKTVPDPYFEQQRLRVLSVLLQSNRSGESGGRAPLIIASAPALARKVASPQDFAASSHTISQGMTITPTTLLSRWTSMGYRREATVGTPGSMAVHGGNIDIFPLNSNEPARIEFFGNRVESIRLFDPLTQRSREQVAQVEVIRAAAEAASDSVLSYLPASSLVTLVDMGAIEVSLSEMEEQMEKERRAEVNSEELSDDSPVACITLEELVRGLNKIGNRLHLTRWATESAEIHRFPFVSPSGYSGQERQLLDKIRSLMDAGCRMVIVSQQAARLSEIFQEDGLAVAPVPSIDRLPPAGSLNLVQGYLPEGWSLANDLVLLTDSEVFGFAKQSRRSRARPVLSRRNFVDLSPGDHAVHIDHGIARFKGMKKLRLNEAEREYLALEYSGGDMLYIPIDQADRVSRYTGSAGTPALNRLGTQEWTRTKQRARDSAKHMAKELLDLYASREVVAGFSFSPDTLWQQELEASFPYVETYDQADAVAQVKDDMEKATPMDRLICGDVGYGKTEIALRAAFKAVMDGKQVAILVPTTVLAQQHFNTFTSRLAPFPTKVEMLSRFRSDREQKTVIDGLKDGTVDICIGTHRLLQKDVAFKRLGLVIIDEEQRFGVAHKELLKRMRREVDVLTLTATPIPRTLHMAMVGVRDMSTLETPPEERLPIMTYVSEFHERLIREAILREMERNGQVFFVHNRVQSIASIARKITEIVPEASIAVAHGQMEEAKLESAMLDFYQGKVDVLLCTTIIESGLDIPNANTLIVNDADKLGLSQLYQLRGRIGRASNRAYAYFMYGKGKRLTEAAEKRLQTIFEASELGAGFRIAMKDLEIRGAGNLLGPEQSGHIAAVGFELYCQLLTEAVSELKDDRGSHHETTHDLNGQLPTVELPLSAYVPENYISDLNTRLSIYQKLARARSENEVQRVEEEMRDRFGRLPKVAEGLLYVMKTRILCAGAGVESISKEDGKLVLRFSESRPLDRRTVAGLPRGVKLGGSRVQLDLQQLKTDWQVVLSQILAGLQGARDPVLSPQPGEPCLQQSAGAFDSRPPR